jgi:hypothetical protein
MNGFAERRTSGPAGRRDSTEGLLTWETASAMLPLAGRIAADLLVHQQRLAALLGEKADLDDRRHQLAWPARSRRYEIASEIAQLEEELRRFQAELQRLGVALLDPHVGLLGFPTIVNDQRAYFSWKPDEPVLAYWNYLADRNRHPVPSEWTRPAHESLPARRKRRNNR